MFSMFENELQKIDAQIASTNPRDIHRLFNNIPLGLFGKLLLDIPDKYQNIKAFFPPMASEEVQKRWTGGHGEALLSNSVSFIKTMIFGYSSITGKKIENANILDYGCGWGRLIRLLYKHVPIENIYGVDPWDKSIDICKHDGVKGNIKISDYMPLSLPFDRQFDLIFAFSVFTHLSEKTTHVVLNTLREYISPEGILVITVRPKEYWGIYNRKELRDEMTKAHDEKGFAFAPHNVAPIDGEISYGDTSMTLAYLANNFPQWKLELVEFNTGDLYQIILFLKPTQ